MAAYLGYRAEVGNNHGVNAYLIKLARKLHHLVHLPVVDQGVHGNVKPDAVEMTVGHGARKLGIIKVFSIGACAKALCANVDRIRAALYRRNEAFKIPCGREQLG